jgi:hypothetical protein
MPTAICVRCHEWQPGPWGGGPLDDAIFLQLLEFLVRRCQLLPDQFTKLGGVGRPLSDLIGSRCLEEQTPPPPRESAVLSGGGAAFQFGSVG